MKRIFKQSQKVLSNTTDLDSIRRSSLATRDSKTVHPRTSGLANFGHVCVRRGVKSKAAEASMSECPRGHDDLREASITAGQTHPRNNTYMYTQGEATAK